MTKKEKFINMIDTLMNEKEDLSEFDPEAVEYWRLFKNATDSAEKPVLTDMGKTEVWKA